MVARATSAAPGTERPTRRAFLLLRVSIVPTLRGGRGDSLGCVSAELDRRGIALVGVTRAGVQCDGEAVAVLVTAGERAEPGDRMPGCAHVGERAGVLADVVAVAADRRRRAGEQAAVGDADVQLDRQR